MLFRSVKKVSDPARDSVGKTRSQSPPLEVPDDGPVGGPTTAEAAVRRAALLTRIGEWEQMVERLSEMRPGRDLIDAVKTLERARDDLYRYDLSLSLEGLDEEARTLALLAQATADGSHVAAVRLAERATALREQREQRARAEADAAAVAMTPGEAFLALRAACLELPESDRAELARALAHSVA
mgnify:FL=1